MESIFIALSLGNIIFSAILVCVSILLPTERLVIHALIISLILTLLKIAMIITIVMVEINVIIKTIIIIESILLTFFWGFIFWISIIQVRALSNKKDQND